MNASPFQLFFLEPQKLNEKNNTTNTKMSLKNPKKFTTKRRNIMQGPNISTKITLNIYTAYRKIHSWYTTFSTFKKEIAKTNLNIYVYILYTNNHKFLHICVWVFTRFISVIIKIFHSNCQLCSDFKLNSLSVVYFSNSIYYIILNNFFWCFLYMCILTSNKNSLNIAIDLFIYLYRFSCIYLDISSLLKQPFLDRKVAWY